MWVPLHRIFLIGICRVQFFLLSYETAINLPRDTRSLSGLPLNTMHATRTLQENERHDLAAIQIIERIGGWYWHDVVDSVVSHSVMRIINCSLDFYSYKLNRYQLTAIIFWSVRVAFENSYMYIRWSWERRRNVHIKPITHVPKRKMMFMVKSIIVYHHLNPSARACNLLCLVRKIWLKRKKERGSSHYLLNKIVVLENSITFVLTGIGQVERYEFNEREREGGRRERLVHGWLNITTILVLWKHFYAHQNNSISNGMWDNDKSERARAYILTL